MKIRYGILRYIYSQYYLTVANGGSMITPFLFHYPKDPYAYLYLNSEIMLGDAILVAPVLFPNLT